MKIQHGCPFFVKDDKSLQKKTFFKSCPLKYLERYYERQRYVASTAPFNIQRNRFLRVQNIDKHTVLFDPSLQKINRINSTNCCGCSIKMYIFLTTEIGPHATKPVGK